MNSNLKKALKFILPPLFLSFYRNLVLKYTKSHFEGMSTRDVMGKIYKEKWWGGKNIDMIYYSGRGSHDKYIIDPYIKSVSSFIKDNDYVTVDIGCGDFNISKNFYHFSKMYYACDIVSDLIEYNSNKFNDHRLHFKTIDLITDELPKGDVLILRQILQHLSNSNIMKIVPKLYSYKYLILTEPIPKSKFKSNIDNPDGPDIRLSLKSGLILDEEPFNLKYISKEELVRIDDNIDNAYIVTTLYKLL